MKLTKYGAKQRARVNRNYQLILSITCRLNIIIKVLPAVLMLSISRCTLSIVCGINV